ncbi:MAG: Ig-like domain repeat protein [Methanobrevibacter sp.]|nr:Ig-like domain repeat protein [Methanobrevibacter sp.]
MISISAVSAASDSASDILSTNDNNHLILEENIKEDVSIGIADNKNNYGNDKLILESNSYELANEKSKLKEGETTPGSFSDLYNLINVEYSGNDTITLDRDYKGRDGNIVIDRELTIDGQGHTLNGSNRTRFFYIVGNNVTLKNINFINGNERDGGAILWNGDNGTVSNCNFNNNYAEVTGGAIIWNGKNGNVIESNFTENYARSGGAILWSAYGNGIDGSVSNNSNFQRNYALLDGGAIYWEGNGSVSNGCTFTENTARNNGGAINWKDGTITNSCKFYKNLANSIGDDGLPKGGGAIFGRDGGTVTNSCQFIENTAKCDENSAKFKGGGAIYFNLWGNVSGCLFINNSADKYGSAIFLRGVCENCIFINNPSEMGYTICVRDEYGYPINNLSGGINNWFGNNATNYNESFLAEEIKCDAWLFLNATAIPNPIPALNPSEIFFKLFVYNNTTNETYEIDNTLLPEVYLESTAINGSLSNYSNRLGNSSIFTGNNVGTGSVTGIIESLEYTIAFTIEKGNSNLIATAEEINYEETATIELSYIDGITETVNITVTGNNGYYEKFDNVPLNNTFTIPDTLLPDEYTITVYYPGNNNLIPVTINTTLIVKKFKSDIDITPYNISVKDENGLMFKIILPKNATGKLDINLTGEENYQVDVADVGIKEGEKLVISLNNNKKTAGEYNLTATYLGDKIYENSTLNASSIIEKFTPEVTAEFSNITYGEDEIVNITINATGPVVIYINDKEYSGELEDGKVSITIPDLPISEIIGEIVYYGDGENTALEMPISFTVSKASPKLNATDLTTTYDKEDYLIITLKGNKDKAINDATIYVELNGITNNYTTVDGQIKVGTKGLEKNTYDVIISYNGDENYNKTNTTAKIIVEAADSSLKAEDINITYGEAINVPVSSINATNVTYEILDKDGNKVKEGTIEANGKVTVSDLPAGEYAVNLTTVVDKNHKSASSTSKITINKASSAISAKDLNVNFGEPISIEIASENASEISYQIKDKNNNIVSNGTIQANENITVQGIAAGEYTVEISYPGNENYTNSNATAKLTVNKLDTELTADEITTTYNISKDLVITLKDSEGNMLSGKIISVDLNGLNNYTSDENGQVKVSSDGLVPNAYDVIISYAGGENYTGSDTISKITINKIDTELAASELNTSYNKEDNLIVTLKDSEGNPISGANISVDLNGEKDYTTDSNGLIKIPTKGLAPSTYTAKITFEATEIYSESSTTTAVTVNKDSTEISASDLNATYKEEDYLVATLKDSEGNPLSGVELSVDLNGSKTFVTDSNGQIKIPTKDLEASKYTATISFDGNENYIESSTSANVIVNRINTRFNFTNMTTVGIEQNVDGRIGKYFYFQLLDEYGNPLAGKKVSMGFNGVVYNRTTNETGWARLQINLRCVNLYTFAVEFDGDDEYAGAFDVALINVTHQTPKLSASNKAYKSTAKTKTLTATLKSAKGNPVSGKKITFTVNGRKYSAKTNSKGVATVKVSLSKKGTYKFTASFAGDNTYKKVSKTGKLTIK